MTNYTTVKSYMAGSAGILPARLRKKLDELQLARCETAGRDACAPIYFRCCISPGSIGEAKGDYEGAIGNKGTC